MRNGKSQTSRWLSSKTASVARSVLFLGKKDREKNSPPNRSLDRYWLRSRGTSRRGAAPRRAERAAGEERWSHLSRFSLFLHPRLIFPPHAYAYAAVSFLRNAHDRSARRYLEHSHSSRHEFSTLASSKGCTGLQPEIRVKNTDERWCQSDRWMIKSPVIKMFRYPR